VTRWSTPTAERRMCDLSNVRCRTSPVTSVLQVSPAGARIGRQDRPRASCHYHAGYHLRVIETKVLRLRAFGGLWVEQSGAISETGPRPRPLALLAILAAAGANGVSRDRVLGILWPESDVERARHALSQTLYSLRRDLNAEVVLSTPDLRLDARQITSDVADFRAAVAAKNWSEAASLYVGPFLNGFYLADAPEFERWAESERAALGGDGIRALELLAKESAAQNRRQDSAEYWRRLTRLDPVNARTTLSYMEALLALGDRTAAMAHGKAYSELVRREFDAEPDQAVGRLMARLRDADSSTVSRVASPPPAPPGVDDGPREQSPVPADIQPPLPQAREMPRPARPRLLLRAHTAILSAGAIGVSVIAALAFRSVTSAHATSPPVLAVGRIRDLVTPDSARLGGVLSEMLATSLGRLNTVQVIANSRMLELTPRDADTSRSALTDAARRAGATEVIEGELIPLSGQQLRLQIRRIDLGRGLVRGGYAISGSDRIELFDSVTTLVAADLRVGAPTTSLADITTHSPIAYRMYEEGLRAYYQFDVYAANRLFRAAAREDSGFAMATYYAWRSAVLAGDTDQITISKRAVSLASHASDRDRLLILTHVGFAVSDPRAVVVAESLATFHMRDPDALIRAAEVLDDLPRAVPLLNRAIALDSAVGIRSTAICRLCDALALLAKLYAWADSAPAFERTLRRWTALRPDDSAPWSREADWLVGFGRAADARAAFRRFEELGGVTRGYDAELSDLIRDVRLDDFDAVNAKCPEFLASADSADYVQYRWYCIIGLRSEGRYREAAALNREGRLPGSERRRRGVAAPDGTIAAILDMETGQARHAADEYSAMYEPLVHSPQLADGERARSGAWVLTLSATAAVAAGDTGRARRLIGRIDSVGQRSLFPRDPRLHHFVRGLLLARSGNQHDAIDEYRAALYSPTFGYTRINYELGRSLLALNRPAEAIPVVQGALHGGLEGSCLYITRTELHELLAQLFDAAGQKDSAAAHYSIVDRAWAHADSTFERRRDAVRLRLRELH
jgi:DNA-binding SARP family transcriptional activator/TolB-like protein